MDNFFQRLATGSLFRRGRDAATDAFASADEHLHQMFTAQPEPGVWMPPGGGGFEQHQQQQPTRIPPASRKAIRQLPTIRVTPEDLVEEANRECCICLEENHLKDRVTRLPCAHIYHPHCILDWLSKNCTCPVCRYELETDDVHYEEQRRVRMRHRKPRFASYELQRMPPKALRELASRLCITLQPGMLEKQELISAIVASDKIDVIAAPEPVEYPLSLLRAMSIRELKRTMADAGVFFDPIDVVEKDDMVRIFVNSGRLVLLPEEQEETEDEVAAADVAAQKPNAQVVQDEQDTKPKSSNKRRKPVLVETVTEGDSDEEPSEGTTATSSSSFIVDRDHPFMEPNDSMMDDNENGDGNGATRDPSQEEEEAGIPQSSPSMEPQQVTSENIDSEATPAVTAEERNTSEEEPSSPMYSDDDVVMEDVSGMTPVSAPLQPPPPPGITTPTAAVPTAQRASRFHKRSISELREVADDMHVDLSGCIERGEMVGRLDKAQQTMVDEFATWNVSDLRAMAREAKVDLSQCTDEETADMAQKLVDAAAAGDGGTHNSHVASYLSALAPLSKLSVSELTGVAREWHVNVSDCLEKGEMIHRLVVSGGPHSNSV